MKLLSAVVGTLVSASVLVGAVPVSASSKAGSCEHVEIAVALSPGQPKSQMISGTHCTPSSPSIMSQVDVLVPGGTYDSTYWDFPYNDYQYSYVDRTTRASRATFNFDRIGTGKSSTPFSAAVTFDADVYTLHQVIDWLKQNRGYNDVTLIGHSAGSIVAVKEAATYNDVNRLVATGFLHSPGYKLLLDFAPGGLYPAILDPQFSQDGLDPLYLTTPPGKRKQIFYSSSAEPGVIAYDEAHKAIISGGEAPVVIGQILLPPALNSSKDVKVPVLTIAGDQDVLCGFLGIGAQCTSTESIYNYEKPFYPKAPNFTAKLIPDTGHDLPLHPSADESFAAIDSWIKTH
jgi:pimeloyl-ACP methyl ester carboxylesterase